MTKKAGKKGKNQAKAKIVDKVEEIKPRKRLLVASSYISWADPTC
jgi:hypothetical protein